MGFGVSNGLKLALLGIVLVDQSWKQFVIHVQKKTKGLLLKNIVRTVKKSYAQNALNGICGVRHLNLIM
jgi:hypothetical protein